MVGTRTKALFCLQAAHCLETSINATMDAATVLSCIVWMCASSLVMPQMPSDCAVHLPECCGVLSLPSNQYHSCSETSMLQTGKNQEQPSRKTVHRAKTYNLRYRLISYNFRYRLILYNLIMISSQPHHDIAQPSDTGWYLNLRPLSRSCRSLKTSWSSACSGPGEQQHVHSILTRSVKL